MSKDAFLYQINFNKKKYPEICEALENAKDDLGVAWYLRELIQRDIEAKKTGVAVMAAPVIEPVSQAPQNVRSNPKPKPASEEIDQLPDGGFC